MKQFTRTVENFKCEKCGHEVSGNGYTNHCPNCLYSKHVDINPGDRACTCHGLMKPVELQQKNGEFVILHRCEKCGFERRNKINDCDNKDSILKLSTNKN